MKDKTTCEILRDNLPSKTNVEITLKVFSVDAKFWREHKLYAFSVNFYLKNDFSSTHTQG